MKFDDVCIFTIATFLKRKKTNFSLKILIGIFEVFYEFLMHTVINLKPALYFSTRFRLGGKVNFLGYQDLLFDLNKRLLLWFLAKRTLLKRNPVFSA